MQMSIMMVHSPEPRHKKKSKEDSNDMEECTNWNYFTNLAITSLQWNIPQITTRKLYNNGTHATTQDKRAEEDYDGSLARKDTIETDLCVYHNMFV